MSNEIAKTQKNSGVIAVAQAQQFDDEMFGGLAKSGNWLPRFQLFGANTEAVKEGKIPMAHYGLVSSEITTDLGTEVDLVAIVWRPKAMELGGGNDIINVYDPKDPEFTRIQQASETPDSGCMYGPEFLIWLPKILKFASYFANNKTARKAVPKLRDRLGMPTTVRAKYIKTEKYSWHGPEFIACSTPFDLPSEEDVAIETERFNNPPKSEIEKAPETTGSSRAR